ncbi:MAG: hypothetical protein AAF938_22095 [Myxococcota bacterium]
MRWGLVAMAALFGCVDATQVNVFVTADPAFDGRVRFVSFEVEVEADPVPDTQVIELGQDGLAQTLRDPLRLTIVPDPLLDPERVFRVRIALLDNDQNTIGERIAIAAMPESGRTEVRLNIDAACADQHACNARETCDAEDGTPRCASACVAVTDPGEIRRSEPIPCDNLTAFAPDGVACSVGDRPGRLWNGECCTTCFDGTRCLPADERTGDLTGDGGQECAPCGCDDGGGAMCAITVRLRSVDLAKNHGCATGSENEDRRALFCWGSNLHGQFGIGAATPYPFEDPPPVRDPKCLARPEQAARDLLRPEQVQDGLVDLRQAPTRILLGRGDGQRAGEVSLGISQSCFVQFKDREDMEDLEVRCAGQGLRGERGDGSNSSVLSFVDASPVTERFDAIAMGFRHGCGVEDGALGCWGAGSDGVLGQGDERASSTPLAVNLPAPVDQVATARREVSALAGGVLYSWGQNERGAAGDPDGSRCEATSQCVLEPRATEGIWTFVSNSSASTCVLNEEGRLFCRGSILSDVGPFVAGGSPPPERQHELTAVSLWRWQRVAVAEGALCGIVDDGSLLCLGNGRSGMLGGPGENLARPGALGWRWTNIVSDHRTFCARREDQTVWCWGANECGQAGSLEASDIRDRTQFESTTVFVAEPRRVCVPGIGE